MRSVARLLVVTLTGIVVALLPVQALAETDQSDREYGLVAQTTTPAAPSTASSDAPTVDLDPAETEADQAESKRKIVMGVTSAVLLGIVIWGRSVRRKKAKAKS